MKINEIGEKECHEILARASLGRLGCALDNQPYVVPIYFAYEPNYIYAFSTDGKKIDWMRTNPKVCLQVDEMEDQSRWATVIANGHYQELVEPQFTVERTHARELLEERQNWWLNALAERRLSMPDAQISPLFFRIRIDSLSGLRGEAGN